MNYPENLAEKEILCEDDIRIENETTCLLGFLEFYSQVNAAFLSEKKKNKLFQRYETDFNFPVTQVRDFIEKLRVHCEFIVRNNIDIPLMKELKQLTLRNDYTKRLTPQYFFESEVMRSYLPDVLREFIEQEYLAFVSLYIEDVTLSEKTEIDDAIILALLQ